MSKAIRIDGKCQGNSAKSHDWEIKNILPKSMLFLVSFLSTLPTYAALPDQVTDMKVLLLAATGTEPTTLSWEATLKQEGVPYQKIVLTPTHTPLTSDTFADTVNGNPHAKYQAVVIATGNLLYQNGANFVSALTPDEWTALNNYETTYSIRQVTAYTFPSADYGLNTPTASQDIGGTTVELTEAGKTAFPYLKGPVLIDTGSWAYMSTPVSTSNFTTFVQGANDSSLVGAYTHPDGREELVVTVDQNEHQLHSLLLRHGMLSWATRGVYLGYSRNYLEVHVDDIFLSDDRWDPTTHTTVTASPIRMTADDVAKANTYQNTTKFVFDFLFNGQGSEEAGGLNDPLTIALLNYKDSFYWVNHTYEHINFNNINDPDVPVQLASVADILSEVTKNINFATSNEIPNFNSAELVTGEHSGLYNNYAAPPGYQAPWPGNPNLGAALEEAGVFWTGSNNSVSPEIYTVPCTSAIENPPPFSNSFTYIPASGPVVINGVTIQPGTSIGDADLTPPTINTANGPATISCTQPNPMYDNPVLTVPRYPTNIYYNVSTQVEQLDEYNYLYLPPPAGSCVNTATTTCFSAPATWDQYVESNAKQMLGHALSNDPRAHYVHQANITGDGILYTVMDSLLSSYKTYMNVPTIHLSLSQIGRVLWFNKLWDNAWKSNQATGYIQNGVITIEYTGSTAIYVPVTGLQLSGGVPYGGQLSSLRVFQPGQTVTYLVSP